MFPALTFHVVSVDINYDSNDHLHYLKNCQTHGRRFPHLNTHYLR